jgi:hypothetical protein
MESESIIVTDKAIISYFKDNPTLDVETMLHIFIDILKKLSSNLSSSINSTVNKEILTLVKDIKSDIAAQKSDIIIRLHETKKEYIDDVKSLMMNSTMSTSEKLATLMERNTDSIVQKTTTILNDVIPKGNQIHQQQIDFFLKDFRNTISEDTKKLLDIANKDDSIVKDFISKMNIQYESMITSLQQPIYSFINSSEERINANLTSVKESSLMCQNSQEKLSTEIIDFLNRYKNNSNLKGSISENMLYELLQKLFPTDEIIDTHKNTASGDFIVKRRSKEKPTILFENKDYKINVHTEEVEKFIRDIKLQKCHGIFLSQFSPITYKKNFQIDIIDGFIVIYIHTVEYNIDKIKAAIDIIDSLSVKLNVLKDDSEIEGGVCVSNNDLDDIVEEFRKYGIQRLELIDTVKLYNKQMLDQIELMQLPLLRKTLIHLGREEEKELKCNYCHSYIGKNKASLSAHIRKCKLTPFQKNIDDSTIPTEYTTSIESTESNIIISTDNTSQVKTKLIPSSSTKKK